MVDFSADIRACVPILQAGGIILYPTDTIWGIGCDARNEAAVEKVFALKQRPKEKSMIILLADARDIFQYIAAPPPDVIHIMESFAGPTTVIFRGALGIAGNALSDDGSIAIRVPADAFCKALLKRAGVPLISTSANRSGGPTAGHFGAIDPVILNGVDYAVHYRRHDTAERRPSRIVRLNDAGDVEVIRP